MSSFIIKNFTEDSKFKFFILLLSLLGAALIILSTSSYGIGIEIDSIPYIATARNILIGDWFINYDNEPLVLWPPLYPILLAFVSFILNTDPLAIANIVNALIFGVTIYLTGLLAKRYFISLTVVFLTVAAVLFSVKLFEVNVMALSEPLFIIFIVLALLHADSYHRKGDIHSLILFSIAAALASVTRYAGVTLIILGIIFILLSGPLQLKFKLLHLLIFLTISSLPLGLWLIRDYFILGSFFAVASPVFSLKDNLNSTLNTILNWYVPIKLGNRFFFIIISAIILFLYLLGKKIGLQKIKNVLNKMGVLILYILIYSVFLIITSSVIAIDRMSDRLIVPIFIPLVFLIILTSEKLISFFKGKISSKTANVFLIILISLWILYSVKTIALNYLPEFLINGVTKYESTHVYNNKFWKESAAIQYLNNNKKVFDGYTVYSNAVDALYILTGLQGQWSPNKFMYNSPDDVEKIEPGLWPYEHEAFLIWFSRIKWPNKFTPEELQKIVKMKEVKRFNDGVIYLMTKD